MRRASTQVTDRRLLAVGGGSALLALVAVVVVLVAGGADEPPATGAARLVPADALAYVHVSTDSDREGVQRATKLLNRFPTLPRVRDTLVRRLTTLGTGVSFGKD